MIRRLIATTSIAALVFTASACGGDSDVSVDTLIEALVDQGMDEELATCISNEVFAQVDQDTFNQIAVAQNADDMPDGAFEMILDVTTDCTLGG